MDTSPDNDDPKCGDCGMPASAHKADSCNGFNGFKLSKSERIAASIEATPAKPNTKIAKEEDASVALVRKVRLSTRYQVPEGRTGRAAPRGKRERKALTPTVEPKTHQELAEQPASWEGRSINAVQFADEVEHLHAMLQGTTEMATYAAFDTIPVTKKMLKGIDHVIAAWTDLRNKLQEKLDAQA